MQQILKTMMNSTICFITAIIDDIFILAAIRCFSGLN